MSQTIQSIRGMEDVLPDQGTLWEKLEDTCRDVFRQYGYRNMRVPIVEYAALFVRGLGEVTDIVEKEMYVFEDRNGEKLALRPEATAGIVRSAIEHNLVYNGPQRVWTAGPLFRYERPQKGRQRQFHQYDVEALGFELVEGSEVNANPRDPANWEGGVWMMPPTLGGDNAMDARTRDLGESDRMTLLFRKR